MIKKKIGVMEYYQPLVLSDGTTTVSAIQLLFSDNIVKVNPVPLPPAIDISLKDKSEDNNTIIYGSIKTSSNWISITDTKTDEFNALKQYLNPPSYTATFPITGEQLREIFCVDSKGNSIPLEKCKTPSLERCNDIKNLINKYSDKFEINTPLRMAHFLGQIGTETQGLNKLEEVTCYKRKDRIKEIFGTTYYCDLFEGYETSWDECGEGHPKQCTPKLAKITSDLVVKDKYVCSPLLIDYTYSCRMGNGTPASGDGSKFLGKGFIHLTGKGQFENISNLWNADLDNASNKKDFAGKDINEITDNIDVALKASMYYWIHSKNVVVNNVIKRGSGNDFADNDDQIFLNQFVNGGQNGANLRKKYKDNALKILKR
jgi:predicted chitinase